MCEGGRQWAVITADGAVASDALGSCARSTCGDCNARATSTQACLIAGSGRAPGRRWPAFIWQCKRIRCGSPIGTPTPASSGTACNLMPFLSAPRADMGDRAPGGGALAAASEWRFSTSARRQLAGDATDWPIAASVKLWTSARRGRPTSCGIGWAGSPAS